MFHYEQNLGPSTAVTYWSGSRCGCVKGGVFSCWARIHRPMESIDFIIDFDIPNMGDGVAV